MSLIGTASLWRAYRTTVAIYQGSFTRGQVARPDASRAPAAVASAASAGASRGNFVEARLPGLSEPVSAIALAGLRSLMRAPEAKMMLLTPLIFAFVFGPAVWRKGHDLPAFGRPLVAIGGMLMLLLGLLQMMGNQFGFDRDGFRVFVLCSARRRDILLGKNLSFAPVTLGFGVVLLVVMQVLCPMRWDHLLAMIPQYISMFLMCCIFTNLASIYTPIYIAAGTLKPTNLKMSTVLLQLLMFMVLFPLTQGITLLPIGVEAITPLAGFSEAIPVYLVLALAECALIVFVYLAMLEWQASLFRARELKILDVVTDRAA
jgi:hypothetical protein